MLRIERIAAPRALAVAVAVFVAAPLTSMAADSAESGGGLALDAITVIAQHLNDARNGIQTQTGASTYVIDEAAIAAAPGGDNNLLNQVVMQAPDVAQAR